MLFARKIVGAIKKALSPVTDRGWHIIQEWTSGAFQADDPVTVDTQLSYFAVFSCVTLISSDMGKLRQKLVGKTADGIWEETTSPAFSPVLRKPNRYQNHIQYKEASAISKLTRGNSYALKQRDNRGVVVALYLLDPDRVVPLVAEDGSIFYRLNQDHLSGLQEAQIVVPASEIIHDRMNCLFHPLVGISPLYACALTSQQGLAIQRQGKNFFGNGARPSGILSAPGEIGDTTAQRLKDYWQDEFTGDNAGKIAVLGDDLKYTPMVMNSSDAQLVEQLKLTAEQICSAFRVPAFKVGIGSMPTFQNGELLNQVYYDNCLQSMIEQYEACMDDGLGIGEGTAVNGRELGVELDLDGLMRMDTATMFKTLGEGVKASVLKVNEARRRLNLPKVDGGDAIWAQEQNWPLGMLAERDPGGLNKSATPPEPAAPAAPEDQTDRALALLYSKSPELIHA
jgi:HK97 family phage portal protein